MSKLLTVFGATGLQGGSVVNYVLQNSELSKIYRLRGITRDVTKPAAVALKEKGVEIVKVSLSSFFHRAFLVSCGRRNSHWVH